MVGGRWRVGGKKVGGKMVGGKMVGGKRVGGKMEGGKMEGGKDNKPLAFPAGVCCSALQVCSEKAAASHSYQSPVKQKHNFTFRFLLTTLVQHCPWSF